MFENLENVLEKFREYFRQIVVFLNVFFFKFIFS